jgi:hypothetical protein
LQSLEQDDREGVETLLPEIKRAFHYGFPIMRSTERAATS